MYFFAVLVAEFSNFNSMKSLQGCFAFQKKAEKKVIKKFKRTFIINAVTKYGDIYKVKIARLSKRQSV